MCHQNLHLLTSHSSSLYFLKFKFHSSSNSFNCSIFFFPIFIIIFSSIFGNGSIFNFAYFSPSSVKKQYFTRLSFSSCSKVRYPSSLSCTILLLINCLGRLVLSRICY